MDLFLQLLVDGIVRGSNIVLLALGFSLAFGVSGVFHFAHGAIYTLAAYIVYQLYTLMGVNLAVAVVGALVVCVIVGTGIEAAIYRPLRDRNTDRNLMVLVSLGILIVIQAIISIIWTSNILHFQIPGKEVQSTLIRIGPVELTEVRLLTFFVCIGLFAVLYFYFLRRTRLGIAMRALISDPTMARVVGVNQRRIILLTFMIASAIAVPGSVLIGWDDGFVPGNGFQLILYSFIAIVFGGIGSIPGTFFGGLIMGIVASLAHWKLGGQWETAVIFVFFLISILFLPSGLFGTKERKAAL
jgi:branched-chain amino acid transport system permease protein